MIRQPTKFAALYAWHRAALAGLRPPVHDGEPQCGWFKTRLVKDGPFVPAVIRIDRDIDPATGELLNPERFVCEVNGQPRDARLAWGSLCKSPISHQEFLDLQDLQARYPQMAGTHAAIEINPEDIRP